MSNEESSEGPPASKRLYVGNLPYHAVDTDVEVIFVDAGFEIQKLDISVDPFSGRNPSYCFVELTSAEEAARAMKELNGQTVLGRPVKINPHTPKRGPKDRDSRPPVLSYDRGWRPQATAPRNVDDSKGSPYVFDRWQRKDAAEHFKGPSEERRRLYVGGLPRIPNTDTLNEEMKELFKDFKIEAVSKLISPHPSTQSKPGSHYYCFVDLPTAADAEAAAQALDGQPTATGGTYRVNLARHNDRKVDREQYPSDEKTAATSPAPVRDFSSNWRSKS